MLAHTILASFTHITHTAHIHIHTQPCSSQSAKDVSGEMRSLSKLKGKVVIVTNVASKVKDGQGAEKGAV